MYEAATAEEALTLCESLKDEPLDLLIADHRTTRRDFAERILAACPNTKIIQISGWPFETIEKDQALLPGALNDTWNWIDADLTLVTIPGAGHFVQQDASDLVTRTMVAWLLRWARNSRE